MSDAIKPTPNMNFLTALAILDGALTIADRITAHLNDKRMRGELTPDEERALDERQEKMFASAAWKPSTKT